MNCPNCALYHPATYTKCVNCGTPLVADHDPSAQQQPVTTQASRVIRPQHSSSSGNGRYGSGYQQEQQPRRGGLPTFVGVLIAAFILLASAGGTIFFLTKPPENQRLLQEGQKQLALGQYAFALKTLTEAAKVKRDDPKVLLSLARAYVGVDQVDKAWDCIVQAQQLGAGVMAEPELASELANYYRQHQNFERAIDLLRPLAAANVPGKKAELADLDAAWGDQTLQDGDLKQSLKCWEEVKDLHDGSRFIEADSRLATIYNKLADDTLRRGDDEEALKYYSRLNVMAPSATSYERTADLYQKQDKLELAIDQMRKAVKLTSDPTMLNRKLASMMAVRGKELLDSGDADAGYGYLQQAQALDPHSKAPTSTIRNVHVDIDPTTGCAHFTAEAWNPGPEALNSLFIHTELYDSKNLKSLWTKDVRVIDEFVPPLAPRDSRPIDVMSAVSVADPSNTEFRVYLNGALYRSYPLGKNANAGSTSSSPLSGLPILRPRITPKPVTSDTLPPTAPDRVTEKDTLPATAPAPGALAPPPGSSPEEKTLKDLE